MFNMTGHKIEITGLHGPSPHDEKVLKEASVDISDFAQVKQAVESKGEYDLLDPSEVAMVVWGEDLARIPLVVFNTEGVVIFKDGAVSGVLEHYEQAARMINLAMGAEQELAQGGHTS